MGNTSGPDGNVPIGDIRPVAWVVSDHSAALDASAAAAAACGLRVTQQLSVEQAATAMSGRENGSLVLIDLSGSMSPDVARLLEKCDQEAQDGRTAVVVTCAPFALDDVAACLSAPFATLLCDPTAADRIFAIRGAMHSTTSVAETDRTAETLRLLHLTDEVARIARALADMPEATADWRGVGDGLTGYRGPPGPSPVPVTAGDIRTMIRWRRRRDMLIGDTLFADPVWDMMLDLAAAHLEAAQVSVSSLCIAAAVPATTALRWIKALTDAGLFVRVPDARDRRRIYIRLADHVATAILDFLGAAKGAGAGLI